MKWNYDSGRIYSVDENNELMAETTFVYKDNGEVDIDHTYVNPSLRGQGVAGKMMEVVAEYLKENKLKAVATCPYANTWIKRNKDSYSAVVSEDIDNCCVACKIEEKH